MRIIVVSRCLGRKRKNPSEYYFHFKGFFNGHKVNTIRVEVPSKEVFFENQGDYILDLEVVELSKGTLSAKPKRYKKLWLNKSP